ncbi:MAG: hypothetical protein QOJ99_1567 [Bryobacterales bacterium]|jgi:hypothetical protein|nr:hypothetical protein [Bryobacterales bacterium]
MAQLALAIEALGEEEKRLVDESARVEQLRLSGAQELHTICRGFIDALNLKLSRPALMLDPRRIFRRYLSRRNSVSVSNQSARQASPD